ncbi:hypothetical protein ACU686_40340 [Yinghuangia aomiensis]
MTAPSACGWCGSSIGVHTTPFGPRCTVHGDRRAGISDAVWPGIEIRCGERGHAVAEARALCGRCGDLFTARGVAEVQQLAAVTWPDHRDTCRGTAAA